MMPSAIIEELAKLLAQEAQVEGNIRQVQTTLSDIKKNISESLVHRFMNMTEGQVPLQENLLEEDLMKEESSHERLLQALFDMKTAIVKQIRPLEEQIVQTNIDYLKETFDREHNKLNECLDGIDQKLMDCHLHMEEYQQVCSSLHILNERLSRLGAEALPISDSLPTADLGEIIRKRLEHLRYQGKI